jgi:glucose/mannose transport system permease protein
MSTSQASAPGRRAGSKPRRSVGRAIAPLFKDRYVSIAVIVPSVVAVAIFVYGLIIWTGYISTVRWDTLRPDYTGVGTANYQSIFANNRFLIDIRNTIVFTIFFVAASLSVGLLIANLIDRGIRGESLLRNIVVFPMALSFIVTGVVWKWVLSPGTGPVRPGDPSNPKGINQLFGLNPETNRWFTDAHVISIGPDSPVYKVLHDIGLGFITSPNIGIPIALLSVVLAAVWQMSGFVMVLYLAGLRAIPEELKEAARVDGCTEWRIFRHIVFPLLIPVTLSAMIILGHISLKIYDLTVAMSKEGPGFATDTPANFMWQTSFRDQMFGRGAAVAIVMLVLVAGVVVPYLVWTRRQEVQS